MTCSLFYNNVLADIITVMSPLFAAIGLSIGLGSRLLRTDDGEDDHGGHIGDHLEELVRDGNAGDLKRPKITAARAMKPRPATIPSV